MAFEPINNGESGLDVRTALNNMLQELYGSIPTPLKFPGESINFQVLIPANTRISTISMVAIAGGPTIRIGTAPNGQDILPDVVLNANSQDIQVNTYFAADTTIYFTFSGAAGTINARIGVINNYY